MAGSVYIGSINTAAGATLTLDLGTLTSRVANILRRNDLNSEIMWWLNFSQTDMAERVDFPSLQGVDIIPIDGDGATYLYNLPTDYSRVDNVYWREVLTRGTPDTYGQGRTLTPLPQEFYQGDRVDFKRLLRTDAPSKSNQPQYYFIVGDQIGVYPVPETGYLGDLEVTYYQIPGDMVKSTDEPTIANHWRQYLIPLAVYWGMTMLEKEDPNKVLMWERRYEDVIKKVKRLVRRSHTVREIIEAPDIGTEGADRMY